MMLFDFAFDSMGLAGAGGIKRSGSRGVETSRMARCSSSTNAISELLSLIAISLIDLDSRSTLGEDGRVDWKARRRALVDGPAARDEAHGKSSPSAEPWPALARPGKGRREDAGVIARGGPAG